MQSGESQCGGLVPGDSLKTLQCYERKGGIGPSFLLLLNMREASRS